MTLPRVASTAPALPPYPAAMTVQALLFDTFGTVVDWRSGVVAELCRLEARGLRADWAALADAWRGEYAPSMDRVRHGERPWTVLDALHRESLVALLPRFGLESLDEATVDDLALAWRRLDPWPDSLPGLRRLRARFTVAPLSNANVALLVAMARRSGLPWDVVFGSDLFRHFKPDPETYLGACELLGLPPGAVMMCAAHNGDLAAARAVGLRTAFIARPREHGPGQRTDLAPEADWDHAVDGIEALADRLGV